MTDSGIPAIPTPYDGVLFRSRTEARWAKFWRELGMDYDYEPQGFVTAAGKPYLPDFIVPAALGLLWVEVKGSWESDPQGIAKFRAIRRRAAESLRYPRGPADRGADAGRQVPRRRRR